MNLKSYFLLYANCIPVKGASRSIIYDLQKGDFNFMPNDLYEILVQYNKTQIQTVFDSAEAAFHPILTEYFDFLINNDFIYLVDSPEELSGFPDIDLCWDRPSLITNAIIDFNGQSLTINDYHSVFKDLIELGCYNLQLRFFPGFNRQFAAEVFAALELYDFQAEIIIAHVTLTDPFYYLDLFKSNSKISSITVSAFDEPLSPTFLAEYQPFEPFLFFTSEVISDQSHCGVIAPYYFSVNLETFTESLQFNSCLNRKVGIDCEGNIKNCPSFIHTYGNIKNSHITDVVGLADFTTYWFINKDNIETCKICEFRYMCTDCRAYLEDVHAKPFKCSYNPLTCEW